MYYMVRFKIVKKKILLITAIVLTYSCTTDDNTRCYQCLEKAGSITIMSEICDWDIDEYIKEQEAYGGEIIECRPKE